MVRIKRKLGSPDFTDGAKRRAFNDPQAWKDECSKLHAVLTDYEPENGAELSDKILQFPSKKKLPEEHEKLQKAGLAVYDLMKILIKLEQDCYSNPDDLLDDVELLIKVMEVVFGEDSLEVVQSHQLRTFLENYFNELPPSRATSAASTINNVDDASADPLTTKYGQIEAMFAAIVEERELDEGNRAICESFKQLPSIKLYPEYYRVIQQPIDLQTIARKIVARDYRDMNELHADLMRCFDNARAFNEPKSAIHTDATRLRKLCNTLRGEIKANHSTNVGQIGRLNYLAKLDEKTSAKIAALPSLPTPTESEIEALRAETSEKEDEENNDEDDDGDGENDEDEDDTSSNNAGDVSKRPASVIPLRRHLAPGVRLGPQGDRLVWDVACLESSDDLCTLYNSMASITEKDEGFEMPRLVACHLFRQPKLATHPGWKKVVRKPIYLGKIASQIRHLKYKDDIDALVKDMRRVAANAKLYYREGTPVYNDTVRCEKALEECYAKLKASGKPIVGPKSGAFIHSKKEYMETIGKSSTETSPSPRKGRPVGSGRRQNAERLAAALENANNVRPVRRQTTARSERSRLDDEDDADGSGDGAASNSSGGSSDEGGGVNEEKEREKAQQLLPRLKAVLTTIMEYVEDDTILIGPFLHLPSKADYPDYYQVITEPIDVTTIQERLKSLKYSDEIKFRRDVDALFNNAKYYNEDSSTIHQDAATLHKLFRAEMKKLNEAEKTGGSNAVLNGDKHTSKESSLDQMLDSAVDSSQQQTVTNLYGPPGESVPLLKAWQILYDTIDQYEDAGGRALTVPFMQLPNKSEYPDYYSVIKKPIAMNKIRQKLENGIKIQKEHQAKCDNSMDEDEVQPTERWMLQTAYYTLDDMLKDMMLMFDNAFTYNDPASQLYRDASTLQRVAIQTARQLTGNSVLPGNLVNVQRKLRSLFLTLMHSVIFHKRDNDEQYMCEKYFKTPFVDWPLNGKLRVVDDVSKLDALTGDELRELIEHLPARGLYDVPTHIDEVFMWVVIGRYVRLDTLQRHVFAVFQAARMDDETDYLSDKFTDTQTLQTQFLRTRDKVCDGEKERLESPAMTIDEDEVRSQVEKDRIARQLRKVEQEKALANKDKDSEGNKAKVEAEDDKMETDDGPSTNGEAKEDEATRNNVEEQKSEPKSEPIASTDTAETTQESKQPETQPQAPPPATMELKMVLSRHPFRLPIDNGSVQSVKAPEDLPDGCRSWDQFVMRRPPNAGPTTSEFCIRVGEFVYVRPPMSSPYPLVARVDRILTDPRGQAVFVGTFYHRPVDVQHESTRLFYHNELIQSMAPGINLPLAAIVGRCCVLPVQDYREYRLTEIPEVDTYMVDSKAVIHSPMEQELRKLPRTCKRLVPTATRCVEDELYYFPSYVQPKKVPSPMITKDDGIPPEQRPRFAQMMQVPGATVPPVALIGRLAQAFQQQQQMARQAQMGVRPPTMQQPPPPHFPPVAAGQQQQRNPIQPVRVMGGGAGGQPWQTAASSSGHDDNSNQVSVSGDETTNQSLARSAVSPDATCGSSEVAQIEQPATPVSGKKRNKRKAKDEDRKPGVVTAFLMYSQAQRATIAATMPDESFGNISKAIGEHWNKLSEDEKEPYREKARVATKVKLDEHERNKEIREQERKEAEERARIEALKPKPPPPAPKPKPPTPSIAQTPGAIGPQHAIQQQQPGAPSPAMSSGVGGPPPAPFGAARMPGAPPSMQFPAGLPPHMQQQYMMQYQAQMQAMHAQRFAMAQQQQQQQQQQGAIGQPQMMPIQRMPAPTPQSQNQMVQPSPSTTSAGGGGAGPFMPVPARTSALAHSESFQRYMDGLKTDRPTFTSFQHTLESTKKQYEVVSRSDETARSMVEPMNGGKTQQPQNGGATQQQETADALWAMHSSMLRDSLGIQKLVDYEDL